MFLEIVSLRIILKASDSLIFQFYEKINPEHCILWTKTPSESTLFRLLGNGSQLITKKLVAIGIRRQIYVRSFVFGKEVNIAWKYECLVHAIPQCIPRIALFCNVEWSSNTQAGGVPLDCPVQFITHLGDWILWHRSLLDGENRHLNFTSGAM